MPAAANTVKNLKFWPTICWLRKVSLVDEDHRGDGGALDHADSVVGQRRAGWPAWPGQDDAPQRQQRPHAERGRRDRLVAIDRQDAAANDLGAECRLVQGKAEDRGREGIELDADPGRASKRKTSCRS